jgi:hypothetical protein
MQVIRNLAGAEHIHNPAIRKFVEQRITDLGGEAFDTDALGHFLVVEPEDAPEAIERQLGFSVVANRFTHIRYDQAGFTPSFEFIEEFPDCFDMVIVLSDDGKGVEVVISKDADPDLIAMCVMFAVIAPEGST